MPASAFRKQARVSVQEISLSLNPILPWFCKSSVSIAATVDAMLVVIFAFHCWRCVNLSMPVTAKQPTTMTTMAARVLKGCGERFAQLSDVSFPSRMDCFRGRRWCTRWTGSRK